LPPKNNFLRLGFGHAKIPYSKQKPN
jgi:hypothetical protein